MKINKICASFGILNSYKLRENNIKQFNSTLKTINSLSFNGSFEIEKTNIEIQKRIALKNKATNLYEEAQKEKVEAVKIGEKYQELGDKTIEKIEFIFNSSDTKLKSDGHYFGKDKKGNDFILFPLKNKNFYVLNEYENEKIVRKTEFLREDGKIKLRNITEFLDSGKYNGIDFNTENKISFITLEYYYTSADSYRENKYIKYRNEEPVQIRLKTESDTIGAYHYTAKEFMYNDGKPYRIDENISGERPSDKNIENRFIFENGKLIRVVEKLKPQVIKLDDGNKIEKITAGKFYEF